eukprot:gene4806-21116_t
MKGTQCCSRKFKEAGIIKADIQTALHTLEQVLGTFEKASSSTVSVNKVESGSSVGLKKRGHKARNCTPIIIAQYVRGNITSPYARALGRGSKLPLVNKLTLLNPVSRVVDSAGLQPKRKEWLEVSTFGQQVADGGLKEVFDLEIRSLMYHLDTFAEEDPQFVGSMKRSLYVDDWMRGDSNYEGALFLSSWEKFW